MPGFSEPCRDCGKPYDDCDCHFKALLFAVVMMFLWGFTLVGLLLMRVLS